MHFFFEVTPEVNTACENTMQGRKGQGLEQFLCFEMGKL